MTTTTGWLIDNLGLLESVGLIGGVDEIIVSPSISDTVFFTSYQKSNKSLYSGSSNIEDDIQVLFGSDPVSQLSLSGIFFDLPDEHGNATDGQAFKDLTDFIENHSLDGYNQLPNMVQVKIGNTEVEEFYLWRSNIGKSMDIQGIIPVFPFSLTLIKELD